MVVFATVAGCKTVVGVGLTIATHWLPLLGTDTRTRTFFWSLTSITGSQTLVGVGLTIAADRLQFFSTPAWTRNFKARFLCGTMSVAFEISGVARFCNQFVFGKGTIVSSGVVLGQWDADRG
jgi:hypothetical protein